MASPSVNSQFKRSMRYELNRCGWDMDGRYNGISFEVEAGWLYVHTRDKDFKYELRHVLPPFWGLPRGTKFTAPQLLSFLETGNDPNAK